MREPQGLTPIPQRPYLIIPSHGDIRGQAFHRWILKGHKRSVHNAGGMSPSLHLLNGFTCTHKCMSADLDLSTATLYLYQYPPPIYGERWKKTKDGTILGAGEHREDIGVVIEPCFNFSVFFAFVFKIRRFKQSPSFFLWFLGHSSQS